MFIKLSHNAQEIYLKPDEIQAITYNKTTSKSYVFIKGSEESFTVDQTPAEIMELIKPKVCHHSWVFDPRGFHFCIHCNQSRLP